MRNLRVIGVIPARYSSTRLPGKPLEDINGKSMVLRVVEQAEKSKLINEVIVATDDTRIIDHLVLHGKKAVMTDPEVRTGTDRCYEAVKDMNADIIVNIQGDEPLLDPETIDLLISSLADTTGAVCSTPVKKITAETDIDNPNVVKVVTDKNMLALYFSRSRIPYNRNDTGNYYKHIGIYAYRSDFLKTFIGLESTMLERSESLEQLRMLENGYKIKCVEVFKDSTGVDTPEDLSKVRKIISEREIR